MVRRVLRKFRIDEISGVFKPAQEHAKVAIMKSAPASKTPMSDRLAALTDNYRRGRPHHTPEQHYASAWMDLSLREREQVREEERGEFQQRLAMKRNLSMDTNIDTDADPMGLAEGQGGRTPQSPTAAFRAAGFQQSLSGQGQPRIGQGRA
jgi:hypothetical protein